MEFNKEIHCSDDNGDPIRTEKGELRLKPNWKDMARDHKGRAFNASLHGEAPKLDDKGKLVMRRRDELRKPMGATNKTESFVAKYREHGYAYRLVADDPGRLDQFKQHDWEPVLDENGVAQMNGGQGRTPSTKLVLMRKPQEWFDADQKQKEELLNANLEKNTKPKEGQYGEGLKTNTSLR